VLPSAVLSQLHKVIGTLIDAGVRASTMTMPRHDPPRAARRGQVVVKGVLATLAACGMLCAEGTRQGGGGGGDEIWESFETQVLHQCLRPDAVRGRLLQALLGSLLGSGRADLGLMDTWITTLGEALLASALGDVVSALPSPTGSSEPLYPKGGVTLFPSALTRQLAMLTGALVRYHLEGVGREEEMNSRGVAGVRDILVAVETSAVYQCAAAALLETVVLVPSENGAPGNWIWALLSRGGESSGIRTVASGLDKLEQWVGGQENRNNNNNNRMDAVTAVELACVVLCGKAWAALTTATVSGSGVTQGGGVQVICDASQRVLAAAAAAAVGSGQGQGGQGGQGEGKKVEDSSRVVRGGRGFPSMDLINKAMSKNRGGNEAGDGEQEDEDEGGVSSSSTSIVLGEAKDRVKRVRRTEPNLLQRLLCREQLGIGQTSSGRREKNRADDDGDDDDEVEEDVGMSWVKGLSFLKQGVEMLQRHAGEMNPAERQELRAYVAKLNAIAIHDLHR